MISLSLSLFLFLLPESSDEYVSIQSEPRLLDNAMPFSAGDVNVTSVGCGARHTAVTLGKYTYVSPKFVDTFMRLLTSWPHLLGTTIDFFVE